MGRKRKKDGVIFSVYISKDIYDKIKNKKYSGVSKSDLVEEALRFVLYGKSEILELTHEREMLKEKIKELTEELDRLNRENERLEKKLQKLEAEDTEDEEASLLSPRERRIRKILKALEEHVGKTYDDAMFELGLPEKETKEILWNYFKADAKPPRWLLTGLADVVIDVRDGVHKGWFGTGIIRHKSEYEVWKEERRMRLGIPLAGSGGAAMVEVRK